MLHVIKKEFKKIEVMRPHPGTLQIPDARQLLGEMTINLWVLLTCIACPLQVQDSPGNDTQPYVPESRYQRCTCTVEKISISKEQGTPHVKKLIECIETEAWVAKNRWSESSFSASQSILDLQGWTEKLDDHNHFCSEGRDIKLLESQ